MNRENADLPINDAVPAPTQIQPGNLFLWNWAAMQEYARTCIAKNCEWQPIETAPDVGVPVLLLIDGQAIEGVRIKRSYASQQEWEPISLASHGCGCCGSDDSDPTHWRSLTAPPSTA